MDFEENMLDGEKRSGILGTVLILSAGIFWGSMPMFVRGVGALGLKPLQITAVRFLIAAFVFSAILCAKDPRGWKIEPRDIPLFIGLGMGSMAFFSFCYFTAIQLMSVSSAVVLLYTSPLWVSILSIPLFKERITKRKLAALASTFTGCALTSGLGGSITPLGFVFGLASGFGYSLYSIIGSMALKRGYSPYTVTAYTFVIAAASTIPLSNPAYIVHVFSDVSNPLGVAFLILGTALFTAVIPSMLYTWGLQRVPASKASIMVSSELVSATVFGAIVLGEPITFAAFMGTLFILVAILLLNIGRRVHLGIHGE